MSTPRCPYWRIRHHRAIGRHGYAYANNSPVSFADPSGLYLFEGSEGGGIGRTSHQQTVTKPEPVCAGDYCVGRPSEPKLDAMHDDWAYDPTVAPTDDDYDRRGSGHALLVACRLAFALGIQPCAGADDAIEEFDHYLDGDGSEWIFDYEEAYREDEWVREGIDVELGELEAAAVELFKATGLTSFQVTGKNHRQPGAETDNWVAALNAHNLWSSADVTVKDGKITVRATLHAVDRFNFNKGMSFLGIPDEYFGRLAVVGLAKNYTLRGTITRDLVVPVTGGVSQVTGPSAPGRTEDENRRRG